MDLDIDGNDHGESDDTNGDGEGVWSPDIEQCFREALLLFPPCGRRKHILQEEGGGKMYGRNELIARHIMMRTGKSRTRKQVSSHIQVLARRKAKAEAATTASVGSTGVSPSPSGGGARMLPQGGVPVSAAAAAGEARLGGGDQLQQQTTRYYDIWVDRPIVTQKIRLVEFSAFIEHRNFQQPPPSGGPIGGHVGSNTTIQQQQQQLPSQTSGPIVGTGLTTTEPDLSLPSASQPPVSANHHHQQQQQQPMQAYSASPATHPLASNHHLPAQFNQATSQLQPHHHQNQHLHNQKIHHPNHQTTAQQAHSQGAHSITVGNTTTSHHNRHHHHHPLQQPQLMSAGFIRHSYVQIDYTQTLGRQANKLERIDISQVQDKFPEIGGSDGLFQRGPSDAFFLVKCWADLNNDFEYNIDDQNSYFGFSSHFETVDPYKDITCSTKACSYGLQVVEKVEKIYGAFNSSNGRYSYDINRSPMCEFMIQFIKKLRQLPRASQMNSVLENFTVLQVITSESTSEILLCLAYVFEVASSSLAAEQNNGPHHHVYKLTKD